MLQTLMKRQVLLAVALLVACIGFAWTCAVIGIDFGYHWDEPILINGLSDAIRSGTWVPRQYNYPSLPYGLMMLNAIPDFLAHLPEIAAQLSGNLYGIGPRPLPGVADAIQQPEFLLRARMIFAAVTLSTGVWVFLIVRMLGRSAWEAVLAAALLVSSWEIGYHARWAVPDGLMMNFAALSVLLVLVALKWRDRGLMWLHASAAVVGLAASSKYPGVLLLLPSAYAAYTILRERSPDATMRKTLMRTLAVMVTCASVMLVVFFLTTPAALVSPLSVLGDAYGEVQHYRRGHYGNTVDGLFDHGPRMIQYFSLEAFSHFWPIALPIFLAAIAGAVDLIRKNRLLGICLLLAPLVYLLYFSGQRVMFVRNTFILFPFIAILAARGFAWGLSFVNNRNLRIAGGGAIVAAIVVNFGWLLVSAQSIHPRSNAELAAETAAYVRAHGSERFYLTDTVRAAMGSDIPANIAASPADAQRMIILNTDYTNYETWVDANRPGTYTIVAGAMDVNLDRYPPWVGRPHHVAITVDHARKMGIVPPASP